MRSHVVNSRKLSEIFVEARFRPGGTGSNRGSKMAAATAEEVLQSLIDTLDLCSEKVKGSLMFSANHTAINNCRNIINLHSLGNSRETFKATKVLFLYTTIQREAWDKLWKTWS